VLRSCFFIFWDDTLKKQIGPLIRDFFYPPRFLSSKYFLTTAF